MRTTTRSATSGSTAVIRSAIAVQGATSTSDRRAAPVHDPRLPRHGRAQPRLQRGRLGAGEEVQRVGEQGPPFTARDDEPDVVQRDPAASPHRARLAGRQPGRAEVAPGADHLDVARGAPLQVVRSARSGTWPPRRSGRPPGRWSPPSSCFPSGVGSGIRRAPPGRAKTSRRSGVARRLPRCAASPARSPATGPRTARARARPPAPRATSGPAAADGRSAGRRGTAAGAAGHCPRDRASGDVRAARPSGHSSQRTGWAMLGTVHSRTPPGRSTRAHSASTAAGSGTYSSTLAATTASRLPAANGSARQPGSSLHPADGVPGVGRGGLAQHRRRDVAAGHPVAGSPPGAGRARRCRSPGRAVRRRRRPGRRRRRRAGPAARPAGRPAAYLAGQPAALASNSVWTWSVTWLRPGAAA